MVTLDAALAALGDALTAAGVAMWRPPDTVAGLEELEAEIAPLRLPEVVAEFWRRVDVGTLQVEPNPSFARPEWALRIWRTARDRFRDLRPLALLEVGYQSHACMSVELEVADVPGGALWRWAVSDPTGFDRQFDSLPDWLAHLAGLVDRGWYDRRDGEHGPYLLVPGVDRDREERASRPAPGTHPVHGTTLHVPFDILQWPEHWKRANGVGPEHTELRGATHSLAEVLASAPEHELQATVAGRVIDLAGGHRGVRVRVADSSAELGVFCPPGTTLVGPRVGDWCEFDIVVPRGPRRVPPDPERAAEGAQTDEEYVKATLRARYGGPAGAVATAVRRLPPSAGR